MSLVNVKCINCKAEFKVSKRVANEKVAGYADSTTLTTDNDVQLTICWFVGPVKSDNQFLCPRCACAAMRLFLHEIEKKLPKLMAGEHLVT